MSSDGKTITLVDNSNASYGVINITSLTSGEFNFTITLAGSSSPTTIFTNVGTIVASSANTDLISKTWKVVKYTINDNQVIIVPTAGVVEKMETTISKYGTYFAMTVTPTQTAMVNRKWQWMDSNENTLCYGETSSECTSANQVKVLEISSTNLKMEENGMYKVVYELVAQ